ncbi:uncharacterized protein LOC125226597 isoform X2 [Leguminivora glycinivorella]|uniref:uncharacterized protein LOC125226597 isoform X2 n=1 Tax=Leguminivora glycinivorella TaxID=1035111 RepID=UPI00200D9506|nr:uncharacterized protein LOC125226597 isoform X2 [Leguminivora glycinivorella]
MLWNFVVLAALVVGSFAFDFPDERYDEYAQKVATDYCKANHAEEKIPEVKTAIIQFSKCLNDTMNIDTLSKEMNKAVESGVYDEIIQMFCAKAPQLKACANERFQGMRACMPAGIERSAMKSTEALIDFVCDNNGARATAFVKAEGPQCITTRYSIMDIFSCPNAIKYNYTKFENIYGDELATAILSMPEKDRCILVDQTLECVLNKTKTCPNPAIWQLGQEFQQVYIESLSCTKVLQHAYAEMDTGLEGTVENVTATTATTGAAGGSTLDVSDNSPYAYSKLVATEICNATHAEEKTPEVQSALITFPKCLDNAANFEVFAKEMEEAESSRWSGVDKAIKKYCVKAPQVKDCTSDLVKGMDPCLPTGLGHTLMKTTNALIDFVCEKDAARVTTFIKEDGPRCIRDSLFYIAYCQQAVQSNLTNLLNATSENDYGLGSLFSLSHQDKCNLVDQSLECLQNSIMSCQKPTLKLLGQELQHVFVESLSCSEVIEPANAETTTEGTEDTAGSLYAGKDIDELKKIKLELEVRAAELDIWNRENEMSVLHTVLTSDIKKKGH